MLDLKSGIAKEPEGAATQPAPAAAGAVAVPVPVINGDDVEGAVEGVEMNVAEDQVVDVQEVAQPQINFNGLQIDGNGEVMVGQILGSWGSQKVQRDGIEYSLYKCRRGTVLAAQEIKTQRTLWERTLSPTPASMPTLPCAPMMGEPDERMLMRQQLKQLQCG